MIKSCTTGGNPHNSGVVGATTGGNPHNSGVVEATTGGSPVEKKNRAKKPLNLHNCWPVLAVLGVGSACYLLNNGFRGGMGKLWLILIYHLSTIIL